MTGFIYRLRLRLGHYLLRGCFQQTSVITARDTGHVRVILYGDSDWVNHYQVCGSRTRRAMRGH